MKYYFIINGTRIGPLTLEQAMQQPLTPDTPAWAEGMSDWVTVSAMPELAQFAKVPPYVGPQNMPPSGYTSEMRPAVRPDNYLVWSILVTLLCCLPGGIVALVYSTKTNSAWETGDYNSAYEYSGKAKTWVIVSAVIGFVTTIISFFIGLTGALSNLM